MLKAGAAAAVVLVPVRGSAASCCFGFGCCCGLPVNASWGRNHTKRAAGVLSGAAVPASSCQLALMGFYTRRLRAWGELATLKKMSPRRCSRSPEFEGSECIRRSPQPRPRRSRCSGSTGTAFLRMRHLATTALRSLTAATGRERVHVDTYAYPVRTRTA